MCMVHEGIVSGLWMTELVRKMGGDMLSVRDRKGDEKWVNGDVIDM